MPNEHVRVVEMARDTGLSEAEINAILGRDQSPINGAEWFKDRLRNMRTPEDYSLLLAECEARGNGNKAEMLAATHEQGNRILLSAAAAARKDRQKLIELLQYANRASSARTCIVVWLTDFYNHG